MHIWFKRPILVSCFSIALRCWYQTYNLRSRYICKVTGCVVDHFPFIFPLLLTCILSNFGLLYSMSLVDKQSWTRLISYYESLSKILVVYYIKGSFSPLSWESSKSSFCPLFVNGGRPNYLNKLACCELEILFVGRESGQ